MSSKFRKILLWIFVGLLSLGQFQRIELTNSMSGVNIYFHDIFILFWLLSFVFTDFTKNMKSICRKISLKKIATNYKLETTFVLILLIGIILNLAKYYDFISILYVLRFFSYILFALSLRYLIANKQLRHQDLRFKLFGAGAIILLLGFLQLIFIKDTRFLAILGWDDHFHRLISTIFDPGFTGIILVISYLYFLSLENIKSNKFVNIITTTGFFWGIALTFSRASYLALVVSLLGLAITSTGIIKGLKASSEIKLKSKEILVSIIIFIVMVVVAPKPGGEGVNLSRTSTIDARQSVLYHQLQTIKTQTLIIGNGLFSKQNSLSALETIDVNHNPIPSHSRIPDNFFVNILLSTGIFGTMLASFILLKWTIKIVNIDPTLGVAILATIVHGQFNNSLFQPFVLLMLLGGIASLKTKA